MMIALILAFSKKVINEIRWIYHIYSLLTPPFLLIRSLYNKKCEPFKNSYIKIKEFLEAHEFLFMYSFKLIFNRIFCFSGRITSMVGVSKNLIKYQEVNVLWENCIIMLIVAHSVADKRTLLSLLSKRWIMVFLWKFLLYSIAQTFLWKN